MPDATPTTARLGDVQVTTHRSRKYVDYNPEHPIVTTIQVVGHRMNKPGFWKATHKVMDNLARNIPKLKDICGKQASRILNNHGRVVCVDNIEIVWEHETREI